MNAKEAEAKILETLSPRTAMQSKRPRAKTMADEKWTAFVFTNRGDRVISCLHDHSRCVAAQHCATRLVKRWARFEAQRGVRP